MFASLRFSFSKHLQHSGLSSSKSVFFGFGSSFSSQTPSNNNEPSIDVAAFQSVLTDLAPSISKSLTANGYYSTQSPYAVLPKDSIRLMRQQSINLRNQGRFQQSWSEKIDSFGNVTRFDKEGVFACEPDGGDYDTAPDLIMYMSVLLQTLPELLNSTATESGDGNDFGLSVASFNAKLAVTSPGGTLYPLHIDNPQGISSGDTRKLTCILYMNPDYQDGDDGGELRIFCGKQHSEISVGEKEAHNHVNDHNVVDITPDGGRMILFWSDEIPHEVLPTAPNANTCDFDRDRYALTVWIPTENYHTIHNPSSKFAQLGEDAFPLKS